MGSWICDGGEGLTVSQISPKNAPFGKRTKVFFRSVKTVSTLRKNTDLIEFFPYWADLRGFLPCNLADLQQPLFFAGWVARSKGKEHLF
jgi:hypothetical protein